jgi:hypothetical protein
LISWRLGEIQCSDYLLGLYRTGRRLEIGRMLGRWEGFRAEGGLSQLDKTAKRRATLELFCIYCKEKEQSMKAVKDCEFIAYLLIRLHDADGSDAAKNSSSICFGSVEYSRCDGNENSKKVDTSLGLQIKPAQSGSGLRASWDFGRGQRTSGA